VLTFTLDCLFFLTTRSPVAQTHGNGNHESLKSFSAETYRVGARFASIIYSRKFVEEATSIKEAHMRYVIAALLAASLGIGQAWALFETNKELSESAAITMDQAVKMAVAAVPGKAVEAQLGKEDGRTVYEIDIIDSSKKERTVYIDAQTGKTMKIDK
jgi:peptidase YpeB-like protein